MSSVFLSHSHSDKPFARKLAADLRASGHNVWIDEAEINVGDSLVTKIREGIDQVDYVVAILSTSSVKSEWVTRELDIASNREIEEKRVVVLPILVEKVALPGFLKGKFYGDFTNPDRYKEQFELVLRALPPTAPTPTASADELARLREQLKQAQAVINTHRAEIDAHRRIAFKGKSAKLIAAIEAENQANPRFAPINNTYAFEVGAGEGVPVTLGYLMHAAAKARWKGAHPLDMLLSIENKWDRVEAMVSAYEEMLGSSVTNSERA